MPIDDGAPVARREPVTEHGIVQAVWAEALAVVTSAQRANDPCLALFQAMDAGLRKTPGHRLLTVLVYFGDHGESQRAYSSRPDEYPLNGRKTLEQAPRMRQVLASGIPFIGHTRQAIVDNYPDHARLLAIGCGSVVNLPVHWGTEVVGTVNLLHAEGHYGEADLPRIEAWAQLALPAFLAVLRRQ
ncbi:MAG: GAF domain-containing protein [Pseudomonadota bacterium]